MNQVNLEKSKCVCPVAGWCDRHGRKMSVREHAKCDALTRISRRLRARPKSLERRELIGPPRPPGMRQSARPQSEIVKFGGGCGGCAARKKKMNAIIPGSGDLVEKITTKTGIKDKWEKWQESKNTRE